MLKKWHFLYYFNMIESHFQEDLIETLENIFEDCIVLKLDPKYKQGIPDLIILYKDKWACLECKRSAHEKHRPNQDYYVDKMCNMSYASFIFPENQDQVIFNLIKFFKNRKEKTNDLE